ncbi:ZN830-like protein [Mya arenaria]|uniref:Zinc finger protein 830 n=1 Tax=Mya arenaria TaxID=6604 RepID=A0ABY7FCI2_MYAAR|nr:zinc finger protein 830-like [Mya arenaria]WAR18691.1 ZN830-like protein [Mya arenaria]
MMATKKKKIVTKDDLRRLMKEKQTTIKGTSKRIDHPLAKYNGLEQLVCVLCNTVIKTDLLWTTHLQTRQHKEKVEDLKKQKERAESVGVKRKAESNGDSGSQKKVRAGVNSNKTGKSLPADFFDSEKLGGKPSSTSRKPLLAQYESDSESDGSEPDSKAQAENAKQTSAAAKPSSSGLPADFFDSGVMPSASTSKEPEEPVKPTAMSDILPEGFFDDPKQDAKVRKIEYVDKMEEEWELFQRSMKEETHVSEAIIEEEDEQVNVDRNIDEIDEQIQCWKEVNDLEVKKEEIMSRGPRDLRPDTDSDDELNEEMLDEFLDWRSKKSWR